MTAENRPSKAAANVCLSFTPEWVAGVVKATVLADAAHLPPASCDWPMEKRAEPAAVHLLVGSGS